jgi:hypothetical protein
MALAQTLPYENIVAVHPAYPDGRIPEPAEILPILPISKGNIPFAALGLTSFWVEFVSVAKPISLFSLGAPVAIEGTNAGIDGAYDVDKLENAQGGRRRILLRFPSGRIENPQAYGEFVKRIPWAQNKTSAPVGGKVIFGEYQPAGGGGTTTAILGTDGGKVIGLAGLVIVGILLVRWALK